MRVIGVSSRVSALTARVLYSNSRKFYRITPTARFSVSIPIRHGFRWHAKSEKRHTLLGNSKYFSQRRVGGSVVIYLQQWRTLLFFIVIVVSVMDSRFSFETCLPRTATKRQPKPKNLTNKAKGHSEEWPKCLNLLVGAKRFELSTPCTP